MGGRSYRLRFTSDEFAGNTLTMTGEVRVGDTTVPGSTVSTEDFGGESRTRMEVETTFAMPSPDPGTVSVRYEVSNPGTTQVSGNDIRIDDLTLECL